MKQSQMKLLDELTQDVTGIKEKGWLHTALTSHFHHLCKVCNGLTQVSYGEADYIVSEYLREYVRD